jgi:hypothetical protein
MAFEIYTTADLIEVIRVQPANPQNFWLDMFTAGTIASDKEAILFDQIGPDFRLAPFVAPNVQGRVMRNQMYQTRSFRPAYVKPKHVVDPNQVRSRRVGEGLLGTMTLEERWDAAVAENMLVERQSIERRWDWMAAQAVIEGEVIVEGDDYPRVIVSFFRDGSLELTLAGTNQWDDPASDPMADIALMRKRAFDLSGSPVTRLIFGTDAWAAFSTHAKVLPLLDVLRRGSTTDFNRTGLSDGAPYEFQGFLAGAQGQGRLDLYTYAGYYHEVSEAGVITNVQILDPGSVVGVGGGMNGYRMFGAIMDKKANLQPLSMFPKMWENEDPSLTYTMTQSAPLMVPAQPNNTFKIKATG